MNDQTPATVEDAHRQWLRIQARIAELSDKGGDIDAEVSRLCDLAYRIERHAVTLSAVAAADVWRLLRMTSDPANEAARDTQDLLIARAHAEVAA